MYGLWLQVMSVMFTKQKHQTAVFVAVKVHALQVKFKLKHITDLFEML